MCRFSYASLLHGIKYNTVHDDFIGLANLKRVNSVNSWMNTAAKMKCQQQWDGVKWFHFDGVCVCVCVLVVALFYWSSFMNRIDDDVYLTCDFTLMGLRVLLYLRFTKSQNKHDRGINTQNTVNKWMKSGWFQIMPNGIWASFFSFFLSSIVVNISQKVPFAHTTTE